MNEAISLYELTCRIRNAVSSQLPGAYWVRAEISEGRQNANGHFYCKFIEKNELPFTLIADTDKKLVEQFGVWGEKSMYGRKYMGTFRTTFIINEEGVIERVISPKEVKTKEHAQQIL